MTDAVLRVPDSGNLADPAVDNELHLNDQGQQVYRQRVTVARTLTERMFARAPYSGYSLWLDTADATYIYISEAPTAAVSGDAAFRGVRVQKDALGNPLGKVQVAEGFAWDSRSSVGWA
jgi:hypothetical protein